LRQCMMPPEGKCTDNYYVFSREPKWGWGYGGQVFHESLSMLAYAYMDPTGAMNSQRVYFERQHQEKILNGFADVLRKGGILVMGKSETLFGAIRARFQTICPIERIYRVI